MIRKLALVCALLGGLVAGIVPALAQQLQINPVGSNPATQTYPAIEYLWKGQIVSGNSSTGSQTVMIYTSGAFPGNRTSGVNPFVFLAPVSFTGETLTPTAVSCGQSAPAGFAKPAGGFLCNVTATFANLHGANEQVFDGSGGAFPAAGDAFLNGGGEVTIDRTTPAILSTTIPAVPPSANVYFKDSSGPSVRYWNIQQTAATFLAVPTTLTATTVGFGINGANTTGGAYNGASTYHYCIAYVDVAGQVGACSADFTAATAGTGSANQIGFSAPAASTGAVGYVVYISLGGGTYSLAYQAPLTGTNCTLTKVETITPACAVTNTTYGQTGSAAVISALTVNTSPVDMQLGGVSGTLLTGNPNGRTTYTYVPSNHLANAGIPTISLPFTVGGIGSATPIAMGTVNIPAGVLNTVGVEIRVCGKFTNTDVNSTVQNVNIYLDAAGSDTAGSPVQIASLAATAGTGTGAAYTGNFCWTGHTSVSGAGATAGSVFGDFSIFSYYLSATPGVAFPAIGGDTKTAAVASLNLAGGGGFENRISIVHTNTTGNATPQLQSLTIEIL